MTMRDAATVPTPELDKRKRVALDTGASRTLTEFYDWLGERGYRLCSLEETHEDFLGPVSTWQPLMVQPEQLFADFFGIDLKKIDAEQRALLEAIRLPETEEVQS